jgi:hypothetical protein
VDLPLSYDPTLLALVLISQRQVVEGAIAHPLTSVRPCLGARVASQHCPILRSGRGKFSRAYQDRQSDFDEARQMRSDSVAPGTTGLAAKKMIQQPGQV